MPSQAQDRFVLNAKETRMSGIRDSDISVHGGFVLNARETKISGIRD